MKWEENIFCTACNSTAFSYPLIDGELFFGPAGPAIRVPLDGTEYDLTTGGKGGTEGRGEGGGGSIV